jgi:hypothetical protein
MQTPKNMAILAGAGVVIVAAVVGGIIFAMNNNKSSSSSNTSSNTNTSTTSSTQSNSSSSSSTSSKKEFNLKDVATFSSDTENKEITVASVEDVTVADDSLYTPEEGNKYVALNTTVKYLGNKIDTFGTVGTSFMNLVDKSGKKYEPTIFNIKTPKLGAGVTTLNKGESNTGYLVFEIPADSNVADYYLEYATDTAPNSTIKIYMK